MNRKNFLQKAGTFGLGIGVLSLIRPTNVEGVSDNSTLENLIGNADISHVADTITEAIGNEDLLTDAKTLSGAVNENTQNLTTESGTKFRFGQDAKGNYGYIIKDSAGADTVIPFKSGECKLLGTYSGNATISLESLGYQNATKDNFLVVIVSMPSPSKMEYYIDFQNHYYTQYGVTAQSPSWDVVGANLVVTGMYLNGYLKNTYEKNNISLVTATSAYGWRLYYIS